MRFLTVEELVARRECSAWSRHWTRRASLLHRSWSSATGNDDLARLYNEGTLLLYRMGFPGLARQACGLVLGLRKRSRGQALATFAIQQWVNLSRLDAAVGRMTHCERRLRALERSIKRLDGRLSPDDLRRISVIGVVERAALHLSRADARSIQALARAVPMPVKVEVEPCLREAEIRCLIKLGQADRALDLVTEGLLGCDDDRIVVPLMVLLSTLRPLTGAEIEVLQRFLLKRLREQPVHSVQVGEFLLRRALPENQIGVAALVQPLLAASVQIGDCMMLRFLRERDPEMMPPQLDEAAQAAYAPAPTVARDVAGRVSGQLNSLLLRAFPVGGGRARP